MVAKQSEPPVRRALGNMMRAAHDLEQAVKQQPDGLTKQELELLQQELTMRVADIHKLIPTHAQ